MRDLPAYPIFSIAVCSGAERRAFLDAVIPSLLQRGIQSSAVFPDSYPLDDRKLEVYRSRCHWCPDGSSRSLCLSERARRTDVLFYFETEYSSPESLSMRTLDVSSFLEKFDENIAGLIDEANHAVAERPVWGCILIGGKSSRMGRPKHLLTNNDGLTWLERTVEIIGDRTAGVVLSGKGDIPGSLAGLPRLADVPGIEGPLSGMTAATRWLPDVAWLVIACDMPGVTAESVSWLLGKRRLGTWGTVPRSAEQGRLEPLYAIYEPQAGTLFEEMQHQNVFRIRAVADCEKVQVIDIPENIMLSWQNVNTPDELQGFAGNDRK